MNNSHLVTCQKNLEGGVCERILMKEQEFLYLNLAVIWIWSKIVSRRIFHSQVIKVKLGVSRNLRVTWRIPFDGMCDHRAREAVGFLASSLLDFLCCVSVSVSPARSPVFSHLASSLQGLWTIRAYKAEQNFLELFDAHQDLHSGL